MLHRSNEVSIIGMSHTVASSRYLRFARSGYDILRDCFQRYDSGSNPRYRAGSI